MYNIASEGDEREREIFFRELSCNICKKRMAICSVCFLIPSGGAYNEVDSLYFVCNTALELYNNG